MSAGTWVAETENAEEPDLDAKMEESTGEKESVKQNPPSRDDSIQGLLQRLKQLNKNEHTLTLANSIFSDLRLRQLAYMLLN